MSDVKFIISKWNIFKEDNVGGYLSEQNKIKDDGYIDKDPFNTTIKYNDLKNWQLNDDQKNVLISYLYYQIFSNLITDKIW